MAAEEAAKRAAEQLGRLKTAKAAADEAAAAVPPEAAVAGPLLLLFELSALTAAGCWFPVGASSPFILINHFYWKALDEDVMRIKLIASTRSN